MASLLYLAKEPFSDGVNHDLKSFRHYDITICACNPGYVDYYKLLGYNVITSNEFFGGVDMRFDVIIGNPPYGSGGNLAIKFLNNCLDLSDTVTMVLPISVRKPSSVNKIRLDAVCIEDITLPDDTFPGSIRTVRQTWVRTDSPRSKIETFTTHPDFEFVSYDQRHEANVFIGIKGGGPAGRVKTENFEHYADTGHHLIKCNKIVQERLVSLEPQFREEALITQVPSLGKNELITIYMNNFPT